MEKSNNILNRVALKPASENLDVFLPYAEKIITEYTGACYEQNISKLPMYGMEEGLYYAITDRIQKEIHNGIRRSVTDAVSIFIRLYEYDNTPIHSVRSITVTAKTGVSGECWMQNGVKKYSHAVQGRYEFFQDSRAGWLLKNIEIFNIEQ